MPSAQAPHILRDQFSAFEAKVNRARKLALRAERQGALAEAEGYLGRIRHLPAKQRAQAEALLQPLRESCLEPPRPEDSVTVGQVRDFLAIYTDDTLVTSLGSNDKDPEWMRQVIRLLALRPRPAPVARPLQWTKPPGPGNLGGGPSPAAKAPALALASSRSLEDVLGL